jgi:acetylglutamate kinase
MKQTLDVIKIGGNIIDSEDALQSFTQLLASRNDPFILVHGGGRQATSLCHKLNIETTMIQGRRVTSPEVLDVAVMVYAGQINKKIVSMLQAQYKNAIGLSGADANVLQAAMRNGSPVNYGMVGDIKPENVAADILSSFIKIGLTPVLSPITHDKKGQLLNTNADTIASVVAQAMSRKYDVKLFYCFEKKGVLHNVDDDASVIDELCYATFEQMKMQGTIASGMLPKLDNAFAALNRHVKEVTIIHALNINESHAGTRLVK